MNEQIQKLYNQADKFASQNRAYNITYKGISGPGNNYFELFHEKFAELIIRECDRYARNTWEHGPLLGRDLLIHFGIVEMSDE
jgi:hypothetical protein